MNRPVTGLDHVLLAVPDLDAAAKAYEALGFTLTPRGDHAEWGTANRCAMFGADYVELIAPVGPGAKADALRAFLAERRGPGLLGLALASSDIHRSREQLAANGVAAGPARSLSRAVETMTGPKTAEFGVADLPPEAVSGLSVFLCQHRTPDIVRQPDWLGHANGTLSVSAATAILHEPERHMLAWEKVCGIGASVPTDDVVTVHLGNGGKLFLCPPDDIGQLHPEAEDEDHPAPPALIALTLTVADPDKTAALLKQNGVHFTRDPSGRVRVDPYDACGVYLEFEGR